MRIHRLVGSLLVACSLTSLGLTVGGGPRVGAQTAELEAPPTKDGVEGEIVDRPSQASVPITPMRADDPRIQAAAAKNAQAPGPARKTGPGEVPAIAPKTLPVGTPAAMDLVGTGSPTAATAKVKDPVVEDAEIRIPAPPDDTKIDAKTKAKRKKFDEKTSKRTERTVTASKFSNADGSETTCPSNRDICRYIGRKRERGCAG